MEEAVTFYNKEGRKLFGVVHLPDKGVVARGKVGINILNPGIKYRVAPNRLNVKIARELCQKGYYVFRFDPQGIGDSDGEISNNDLVGDIWGKIQTGLFVSDTVIANNFFINKYEIHKLILIGNCGGAITALLTSAVDPKVDGLCLIDTPLYLWRSKTSFADLTIEGSRGADWLFSEYMKRLFRAESWYRLLTMKTNYRAIWKTISIKLHKELKSPTKNVSLSDNLETICQEKKLNRLFFESFEAFFQGNKPILFVLAGNDPGLETFQHYFQEGYLKKKRQNKEIHKLVEIFLIEMANHTYTHMECQEKLLKKISGWTDSINLAFGEK